MTPAQNNDSEHDIFTEEWFEAQSKEWLVYYAYAQHVESSLLQDKINKICEIVMEEE